MLSASHGMCSNPITHPAGSVSLWRRAAGIVPSSVPKGQALLFLCSARDVIQRPAPFFISTGLNLFPFSTFLYSISKKASSMRRPGNLSDCRTHYAVAPHAIISELFFFFFSLIVSILTTVLIQQALILVSFLEELNTCWLA